MALYKTKSEIKADQTSKKIAEILIQREERWNQSQQEKLKQRLEEKLKKVQGLRITHESCYKIVSPGELQPRQ